MRKRSNVHKIGKIGTESKERNAGLPEAFCAGRGGGQVLGKCADACNMAGVTAAFCLDDLVEGPDDQVLAKSGVSEKLR